jgi:hypothetical protein
MSEDNQMDIDNNTSSVPKIVNLDDDYFEDIMKLLFEMIKIKNPEKKNAIEKINTMNGYLQTLNNPDYLEVISKLTPDLFNNEYITQALGNTSIGDSNDQMQNSLLVESRNEILQRKILELQQELQNFTQKLNELDKNKQTDKIYKPVLDSLGKFFNIINMHFMLDYDYYKKMFVDEPEEALRDAVHQLYRGLNPIGSNNPNTKFTYTFNINKATNDIEVVHQLFGDLFMIRSEIPHDFSDINNKNLYKKIIDLMIYEYIYTNITD